MQWQKGLLHRGGNIAENTSIRRNKEKMDENNKIWLVCETNPWPDNYVGIFFFTKVSKENKHGFSTHHTIQSAIIRAKFLLEKYEVKQIRLFYPNRESIIVKLKKNTEAKFTEIRSRES